MSSPEQGVTARWHCTSSALASSSFTTKRERQVAERFVQADRPLSSGGYELRQTLGEGDRRTGWKEAPKAAEVEQELNWQAGHRQVVGAARVVAMDAR